MAKSVKGKWKFESSDGLDEHMKALEVNFALRKIGGFQKPQEEIRCEDDTWFLDIYSTFKNIHLKFKLDEEFDESTVDGRKVKSTFRSEDGKLIHYQVGKPCDVTITRELVDDDTLKITMIPTGREGTCTRIFKRIE